LYDWQFNPVSFDGTIKYRWVNETYSGQATTKELYEMFISQYDDLKDNKELIKQIASEVESKYQMGGLADGLYLDFATDVAIRYADMVAKK
jgi:hypothetical protein